LTFNCIFDIILSGFMSVVFVLMFLLGGGLLFFRRKSMSSMMKAVTAAVFAIGLVYVLFVVYLAVMWG